MLVDDDVTQDTMTCPQPPPRPVCGNCGEIAWVPVDARGWCAVCAWVDA